MATKQGWEDFNQIIPTIKHARETIKQINSVIETLKNCKAEIMDDTTRRAELKEIIDIHPGYTVTGLSDELQKMITLQTFLEDNAYIGE